MPAKHVHTMSAAEGVALQATCIAMDAIYKRTAVNTYTAQQFESLGRLVATQCCRTGHRTRIVVQPEIAGNALLVIVEHSEAEAPHQIVYGIEPDGYTHT